MPVFERDTGHRILYFNDLRLGAREKQCLGHLYLGILAHMRRNSSMRTSNGFGLLELITLNPLNTNFDLFSVGKDGDSRGPLNAAASRHDIIRANNGAFVGRAEDY